MSLQFTIFPHYTRCYIKQPLGFERSNTHPGRIMVYVVFQLTPPWNPQAEDMRAPGCKVCAAKVQSPRKPQCSRSVEAGMSNAELTAARLLPVTLSPVIFQINSSITKLYDIYMVLKIPALKYITTFRKTPSSASLATCWNYLPVLRASVSQPAGCLSLVT
jgi:hypothetical protein